MLTNDNKLGEWVLPRITDPSWVSAADKVYQARTPGPLSSKLVQMFANSPGKYVDPMAGVGSFPIYGSVLSQGLGFFSTPFSVEWLAIDMLDPAIGVLRKVICDRSLPITAISGDCLEVMPLISEDYFDAAIMYPPMGSTDPRIKYPQQQCQLGNARFGGGWDALIQKTFRELLRIVRPGGKMIMVTRDHVRRGQRVEVAQWVARAGCDVGWKLTGWYSHVTAGKTSFYWIGKSKGLPMVSTEEIVVWTKSPPIGN
jgi:SAM-dependent methyltransferase